MSERDNWEKGIERRCKEYEKGFKIAIREIVGHRLYRQLDMLVGLLDLTDKSDGEIYIAIKESIKFVKQEIKENL